MLLSFEPAMKIEPWLGEELGDTGTCLFLPHLLRWRWSLSIEMTHSSCTWDSIISKDLSFLKNAYGSVHWSRNSTTIISDLAADRVQWRRLIRGQATADV